VRSLVKTISPEPLCLAPVAADKAAEHPLLSPLCEMTLKDKTEQHLRRKLLLYTAYFTNLAPSPVDILFLLGATSDEYNWVNLAKPQRQDGSHALSACNEHINREIPVNERIQRAHQPADLRPRHLRQRIRQTSTPGWRNSWSTSLRE